MCDAQLLDLYRYFAAGNSAVMVRAEMKEFVYGDSQIFVRTGNERATTSLWVPTAHIVIPCVSLRDPEKQR